MPFLSTYRLQLHKDFKFQDAIEHLRYWSDLGISHLYLSPILESEEGSTHGYDGTNPEVISRERGGEEGFALLIENLPKTRIEGLILDIVPNHLSSSWKNPKWWDVLKKGHKSSFWKAFDIKGDEDDSKIKIILPVLGKSREATILSRELVLSFYQEQITFKYYDAHYPVSESSYDLVFQELEKRIEKKHLKSISALSKWAQESVSNLNVLLHSLSQVPVKALNEILEKQHYKLKDWRSGSREINYRRFFDINGLVGLKMENKSVFNWSHDKIFSLLSTYPAIQGLRIDHIDGLTFPEEYLKNLSKKCPNIWVEKILGNGELLPEDWPIKGSTGYEFSVVSARLFVDVKGLLNLHSHYLEKIDDRWERFHDCVYESKKEMLELYYVSELNYLMEQFYECAQDYKKYRNKFTKEEIREVLIEVTSSLRIYRTYAKKSEAIRSPWLSDALKEAQGRGKISNLQAYEWFRDVLHEEGTWSDDLFLTIKRWEQLTGPVMAKGLEDTALYRYCPLLSLNGVGGEPDWIGDGSLEYHAFQQEKLRTFPLSFNATSTHDTKRSEDVRSRIHYLSEVPQEWTTLFEEILQDFGQQDFPTPRVLYFILETLLGAWPMDGVMSDEFIKRMQEYFIKATRESKTETSWSEVNPDFEEKLKQFVHDLLHPTGKGDKRLLKKLSAFAEKCSFYGAFNSLSLLTMKGTSPGIADFYQGCDSWDLSLVDPDNRRPVDYAERKQFLARMQAQAKIDASSYLQEISKNWKSGEVKMYLTWRLLQLRNHWPDIFLKGEYLPVSPEGDKKIHFMSYLRRLDKQWVLTVIPRFLGQSKMELGDLKLHDQELLSVKFDLPEDAPKTWMNVLTGEKMFGNSFTAQNLFGSFPVVVLQGVAD
ncbi:malto-oligosyltrehalose synthase [Bdellovibrio sp. SKB1291214]|uniref:malto-oligosyltrehalose synthase n=1 Tax=Bdellovibrio sp. SKB1291214 TaxID=1732569 RepID=UPI00223EC868|nr:malto-oligosyltrehalose synthase [Bdellovibrio sp. SKB1291214]UYL09622.1 malto-oligosyltrehalose synthase [Bdellovibrio sp. SKB1291214]